MIVVISGPQGVGKTTVIDKILKRNSNFSLSKSSTTRPIRSKEKNGVEYDFLSLKQFNELESLDFFIEVIEFNGNKYATPRKNIKENTILNVTASSIETFLKILNGKNFITIFLTASLQEIIRRLNNREDKDINSKLKEIKHQLSYKDKFQYTIENNDIDSTVEKIERIMKS
ncbi:hypothetical protein AB836_01565 [Rickettsiales bacterium (ex Bugula neritina AB1)]|nr:hypothetical protein AB836_01565 [Rickettsiales bacterium (ex Bugula neritina AB1)]